jgi:hypothetical protein
MLQQREVSISQQRLAEIQPFAKHGESVQKSRDSGPIGGEICRPKPAETLFSSVPA